MHTKPQLLHRSLSETLVDIEHQIIQVHREAEKRHTVPHRVRDPLGNFMLTPLLVAKAQVLHALTLLEIQGE